MSADEAAVEEERASDEFTESFLAQLTPADVSPHMADTDPPPVTPPMRLPFLYPSVPPLER